MSEPELPGGVSASLEVPLSPRFIAVVLAGLGTLALALGLTLVLWPSEPDPADDAVADELIDADTGFTRQQTEELMVEIGYVMPGGEAWSVDWTAGSDEDDDGR